VLPRKNMEGRRLLCCCSHYPELTPPPLPKLSDLPTTAADSTRPLVTCVTPTTDARHWAHESLYTCFAHQTYPNKELVVLDTGASASPFFTKLDDERVSYTHIPFGAHLSLKEVVQSLKQFAEPATHARTDDRQAWEEAWRPTITALGKVQLALDSPQDVDASNDMRERAEARRRALKGALSIGAKRNWLAANARGEIHANFDDDDVYLPTYLARMVGALVHSDAELVKLAAFIEYDSKNDCCSRFGKSSADVPALMPKLDDFVELLSAPGMHVRSAMPCLLPLLPIPHRATVTATHPSPLLPAPTQGHTIRWGYGFTYVYTQRLSLRCPYPPVEPMGEDVQMVRSAAKLSTGSAWMPPDTTPQEQLRPCVAFADAVGDAVVCHVKHRTNTSAVLNLAPLLAGPVQRDKLDQLFSDPCFELVQPARRAMARETAEKQAQRSGPYRAGSRPPVRSW
jgi:hypothetical protein